MYNIGISDINYVENVSDKLKKILNENAVIFSKELGKFNGGEASIALNDDNVEPKFIKARPIPFAIKQKVEDEIDRLVSLGIVTHTNYSRWATPVVPVLKKDGSIRLCGDYKVTVNPHIRIDQYPIPRIEELFCKLHGGVYFSKLDLSQAYQQICIDEPSQELLTISTHKGLFKYNRLNYGVASAPAKFQKIMDSVLGGMEGVVVFLDDILIMGKDEQEHLERLDQVLKKLNEVGFRLSLDKCSFFSR
ncbi:uncharacterized protein K02A2.6-like [Coccinella septempunctata]|uniref:uncharacterized protein K02A2.6-like n=1 Tax=Coccinella septempunctata TaxID=41139 RepID=UPI001D093C0A|nr:uncharacterized protein K02A2.6-like [Coccinella septempunctata]